MYTWCINYTNMTTQHAFTSTSCISVPVIGWLLGGICLLSMDNDLIPRMIVFPVDTINLIRVGSQAQHAHEHAGTHERFFPRLEQTCWGTLACSHTSVSHTACTYTSVSHQCYDTLKRNLARKTIFLKSVREQLADNFGQIAPSHLLMLDCCLRG